MAELFTLSAPDLAALLCSRVCHDIISPVGAINNGLELLDEGGADEDAMKLIRQSAKNASARLQFARIAFGAAGSAGMLIDTGDAEAVAIAFLKNEKPELVWNGTRALLPKNKVKLLLNLVALGAVALPRGGMVNVEIAGTPPAVSFVVKAKGDSARLNDQVKSLLSGANGVAVDAHLVQPYYARRVATAAGMTVTVEARDGEVDLKAV